MQLPGLWIFLACVLRYRISSKDLRRPWQQTEVFHSEDIFGYQTNPAKKLV